MESNCDVNCEPPKNMNPLVSIVISTWNRVELLSEALDSVLIQDYPRYEIIVVDNASDDGTKEFMEEFSEKHGDVLFMYKRMDNSNYTAMETLNEGFNWANGKYILVLDDDAKMDQTFTLSHLVHRMEENDNLALITPNILAPSGVPQMIEYRGENHRTYSYCGACALMRSSVFYSIGLYDESLVLYWNEADVNIKLLYRGYDVIYDDTVSTTHYFSEKQRVRKKMLYYHMRNGNLFLNKCLSFPNRIKMVPIRCLGVLVFIHREFDFDPVYLSRILLLVVRSLINIFEMSNRYKPLNRKIYKEVNDKIMQIHLEENKNISFNGAKEELLKLRNKDVGKVNGS